MVAPPCKSAKLLMYVCRFVRSPTTALQSKCRRVTNRTIPFFLAGWRRTCASSTKTSGGNVAALLRQQGYVTPMVAFSQENAADMLQKLWDYERTCDDGLSGNARFKTHVLLPWVADIVRAPVVLDALEQFLGQNILVWSSGWAIKRPDSSGFYSWHQDSTYAGVVPDNDVVVAWFAFTATNRGNGCVQYIPGSHQVQLPHIDNFEEDNLLSRGQHVPASSIDQSSAVDAELKPGELALHHFKCVHGSGPNQSSAARVGLQVIYMATHCKKKSGGREGAMLVRGSDEFQHWELEPLPAVPMGESEVSAHRHSIELENQNYFADSQGRKGYHK